METIRTLDMLVSECRRKTARIRREAKRKRRVYAYVVSRPAYGASPAQIVFTGSLQDQRVDLVVDATPTLGEDLEPNGGYWLRLYSPCRIECNTQAETTEDVFDDKNVRSVLCRMFAACLPTRGSLMKARGIL